MMDNKEIGIFYKSEKSIPKPHRRECERSRRGRQTTKIFEGKDAKGHSFCEFHGIEGHDIQSCEEFRNLLQNMMDNKEIGIFYKSEEVDRGEICASNNQSSGFPYSADRPLIIYYDAKKEPVKPKMIIEVPSPFPYKNNKTVPWRYDVNIVTPEVGNSKAITEDVG
ncbi:hypothetical protein GOBAR_AA22539 [Gossypium barbadense]|uniref:Uncharacterized protein n=1 Tax=Gossypium barbadense TaxID=3634 RepID=A0A2P5X467_GOSBA|nr:hypothetical protein GOBAR_AA22539 [Gossypium barbadense]